MESDGFLQATGRSGLAESGTATYNDVYEAKEGDPDVDPIAAMQNMACEMEKRMGIYPNVPRLTPTEPPDRCARFGSCNMRPPSVRELGRGRTFPSFDCSSGRRRGRGAQKPMDTVDLQMEAARCMPLRRQTCSRGRSTSN